MERPPNLSIEIGDRRVQCENGKDRKLLFQAKAIGGNMQFARGLSISRLMLIKDVCQKYSLGKAQRSVKHAIDWLSAFGHR